MSVPVVQTLAGTLSNTIHHDDKDVQAANQILTELYNDGVITNTVMVNDGPDKQQGCITPAAVALLHSAIHFFCWDGDVRRGSEEILGMLVHRSEQSVLSTYASYQEVLNKLWSILQRCITNEVHRQRDRGDTVIGLDLMLSAIFQTMYHIGEDIDTAHRFHNFIRTLNVTLVDHTSNEIISTLELSEHSPLKCYSEKLEGIMVGMTLYPEVTYRLTLNSVALIPKYDSNVNVNHVCEHITHQRRILVLDANFTYHYVSGQRDHHQERTTQPGYSYIGFNSDSFLDGLLMVTLSIGVQQPWMRLDQVIDLSKILKIPDGFGGQ